MKGLFPQYDHSSTVNFEETWKNALFVFDTNVLLNLYRYQESTREELLNVIEKLSERVWLPHHVALEFQRNRLTVIAGQGRRFTDIRKVIENAKANLSKDIHNLQLKQRHALINPEPLISGFEKLTENFLRELEELQKSQQTLTARDPLKERIEELFNKKVGPAYPDQEEINKKNKEAEERYKNKFPPGYKDDDKDKDSPDEFLHNGLIYKRKYGDYFVWTQLLAMAATYPNKKVIFITDDSKEDWWTHVELDGIKTTGPRVELVDEALRIGKLETFLMYKPEGFLKYSKEFLAASVSEETLSEVHDVSQANKKQILGEKLLAFKAITTAVLNFALTKHNTAFLIKEGYADILGVDDISLHAYDIKIFRSPRIDIYEQALNRAKNNLLTRDLESFTLIFIVETMEAAERTLEILRSINMQNAPDNLLICLGQTITIGSSDTFIPIRESRYNDLII